MSEQATGGIIQAPAAIAGENNHCDTLPPKVVEGLGFITLKVTSDADIQLVRDLCENKLKRDPSRKPLTRIRVEAKRAPIRLSGYNDFAKRDDYQGKKFVHFTSGSEIEVTSRNAYGKLIIRWPDGNMTPISQREFEATFSRK